MEKWVSTMENDWLMKKNSLTLNSQIYRAVITKNFNKRVYISCSLRLLQFWYTVLFAPNKSTLKKKFRYVWLFCRWVDLMRFLRSSLKYYNLNHFIWYWLLRSYVFHAPVHTFFNQVFIKGIYYIYKILTLVPKYQISIVRAFEPN